MAARVPEGPRVRVAALMLLDHKVVLVRHRSSASTYYLLPGGGVGYRETLEDALIREVDEETGLLARIGNPVFVSDTIDPNGPRHVVNVTFLATIVGGQISDSPRDSRVESVELFDPVALAGLDLRPPMADAIVGVLSQGDCCARYLGSLFRDPPTNDGPDA